MLDIFGLELFDKSILIFALDYCDEVSINPVYEWVDIYCEKQSVHKTK